ncbi:MAG: histone deacetylase family protein [Candidatus Lokiarchaeota archaeon]|nr:histone deacetylase family protein [Candidatus Lokiarchaeota archaeon]
MKIVFHERYYNSNYAMDPAAAPGRLEGIVDILSKNEDYEFIEPNPAKKEDILRAHTERHFSYVKRDPLLLELASLAAGGAILAAEEAYIGNPTFAVIRPPGHHASADSCWGFCYFNNISISLLKLYSEDKIKSAFVLDFDLHTGDGNINILTFRDDGFLVKILNPDSSVRTGYIKEVQKYLEELENIDIFVASAGFDQGIEDWGHLLYPEDYDELGKLMKVYSEKLCEGRRYALLEGGYNHEVLPKNVNSFCQGFK